MKQNEHIVVDCNNFVEVNYNDNQHSIYYIVVIYEKNVRRKRVSTEQGEICIVKS